MNVQKFSAGLDVSHVDSKREKNAPVYFLGRDGTGKGLFVWGRRPGRCALDAERGRLFRGQSPP